MISKILVSTDGSEIALRAVQYAAFLSKKLEAPVTLVHVVEFAATILSVAATTDESRRQIQAELLESGRSIIRLSQKPLADAGLAANYEILEGRAAEKICQYAAENNFDLIILGSRGKSKVSRLLLGSVSDAGVRNAPCPVMVVR